MRESSEELLADIDATLSELMQTAEALKAAKSAHHFSYEVELLENTQESLLARLLHRQSILEMDERKKMLDSIKKEDIEKKVVEYAKSLKKRRRRKSSSTRQSS